MEMKIVGITVAILVSITVLAGVLMPVLDDATATTDTFTNEGYFRMSKITATDGTTNTISWASSSPSKIIVNDVEMDVSSFGLPTGYASVTIFASETDIIRIGANNDGTYLNWIQMRGSSVGYSSASTNFTATITGGTLSATLDAANKSATYVDAYVIDPSNTGDYVMKKADTTAYMLEDSEYYSIGVTNITGGYYIFKVTGTVENATVTTVLTQPDAFNDPTITDTSVVATAVSDYIELYQFDKVTFTATGNDVTLPCEYSYVIVPHEVTAERSVHFTDNQNALLAVIPMLVIVAILIGVVALVIRSRLD